MCQCFFICLLLLFIFLYFILVIMDNYFMNGQYQHDQYKHREGQFKCCITKSKTKRYFYYLNSTFFDYMYMYLYCCISFYYSNLVYSLYTCIGQTTKIFMTVMKKLVVLEIYLTNISNIFFYIFIQQQILHDF